MPATQTAAEINGKPSHDDLRSLLCRAINPSELWGMDSPFVMEVGDTDCIVQKDGKSLRYPYTVTADGTAVELGAPVPVTLAWRDAGGTQLAREAEAGTLAFVTDLRGLTFSESGETVPIEVCRDGKWKHPSYGDVEITPATRASFIANFTDNVRKVGDLPLDYDHERGPAPGWIAGLRNEGSSLMADVRLTPSGTEKIRAGEYRFFSPEWHPDWQDPETGTKHGPTLFGGGLTNRPFFRGMAAIQCSEPTPATGAGVGAPAGQDAGAKPQETIQMSDVQKGDENVQVQTADEVRRMSERLTAIEAENASLRAAEERRTVTDAVSGLTFSEGKVTLGPESKNGLVDALLEIPSASRAKVIEAVKGLKFAELGERGFTAPETEGGELSAHEEQACRDMAARNGQKFEEVRAAFLDVKKRRAGQ